MQQNELNAFDKPTKIYKKNPESRFGEGGLNMVRPGVIKYNAPS